MKTLIAEDNPINQRLMELMLAHLGFNCTIVNNGEDAWKEAITGNYSIVFMDIEMPIMNGLDAAKKIRAEMLNAGENIIIVAVSASDITEKQCRAVGINAFMPKPIELNTLRKLLREYLVLQDTA